MAAPRVCSLVIVTALMLPVALVSTSATAAAAAGPSVTATGFTFVPDTSPSAAFAGDLTGGAVVENTTNKVATDVEVTLVVKDARGKKIADSTETLAYIAPGDEAYVEWGTTYPYKAVPATMTGKVTGVGTMMSQKAWAEDAQYALAPGDTGAPDPIPIGDVVLEFTDLRYHDDGLRSSIVGAVRARSGLELTGLRVECVAFQGGKLVAGGHIDLPVIPAGGEAGVQAWGPLGGLAPDDLRCSGALANLNAGVGSFDTALVVRDQGFSGTADEYTAGALIENPSDEYAYGLEVGFDFLDAGGHVVATEASKGVPTYLAPHGVTSVGFGGTLADAKSFAGTPTQLRVHVDPGSFVKPGRAIVKEAGYDPAAWTFEFSDVHLGDLGAIVGTIRNTSKRSINALDINCGLFRNGAMVGAASSESDSALDGKILQAGASLPFEVGVGYDAAAPDEFRCTGTIGMNSDV